MKEKDYCRKLLSALKYETKFPRSLDFFKKLLLNPETKMSDFLFLYEFVLFYNRCFTRNTISDLEKILTKIEMKSTSFTEFQKNFQRRQIFDPVKVVLEEEKNEMIFLEEFRKSRLFTSQTFFHLSSSPFGDSFKLASKQNILLLENLGKSFFEALESKNFQAFKKSAERFDVEYNFLLIETVELWFSRTTIINSFFTVKKSRLSRFYLLLSLFFLDYKLSLFLVSLGSFNHLSDDIRLKGRLFSEKDENRFVGLLDNPDFREIFEIVKSIKLITWVKLFQDLENKNNKKDD